MKLLLDESIPRQLAKHFPNDFETRTVPQMGWSGTANGALLQLAADHGFDALVTADRGIVYQQNRTTLPLRGVVMVAARTRLQELRPLVPKVVEVLGSSSAIDIYHVAA